MAESHKRQWDTHWASLSNTLGTRDVYYVLDETKLSYLTPKLPKRGRSLEVGCGSARLSYLLARQGLETYGLDYSQQALGVAQENYRVGGAVGHFVVSNAFQVPFEDDSFDVVLSTGLLEHFTDPGGIVREMVRVLKPGGLFYSDIVPSKFSSLRLFDYFLRPPDVFERSFDRGEIEALLRGTGCLTDIVVLPAGVALPLWIPLVYRSHTYRAGHAQLTMALKSWLASLDGTAVAEALGFYYLCLGRKRIAP